MDVTNNGSGTTGNIVVFGGTRAQIYAYNGQTIESDEVGLTVGKMKMYAYLDYNGITKKLNKLSGTQKAYIVDDNRTLNQYKHTATHELGHALGWKGHSPNSADVMYAYSNGIISLTNRDKKQILQFYMDV